MTARLPIRDDALPEGTRLGGCAVAGVLAQDELGFVYRMTDSLLLGRVAIKEYFPRALAERVGQEVCPRPGSEHAYEAGLQAFAEEARLLARLEQPGLLHVLDAFDAHQTAYQVMPLVEGHTLDEARQLRKEPPDVAWLRELLLAMLEPVQALHAAGALHGDIRPRKVLLRQGDGRPLLMGFGTVGRALHVPLDPAYAPIEQTPIGGHLPRGAWTDVYSLAAVTWFAATGRAPVASTERAGALFVPAAAMEAVLASAGGEARDRAQLVAAVDRAMAVLPPDRPQSAAELRALFTAPAPAPAMAQAPLAARPEAEPPPVPLEVPAASLPLPRLRDRRRVPVGAWVAALLLCVAVGALGWRWNEVLQASRTLASAARPVGEPMPPVAVVAPAPAPAQAEPAPTPMPAEPALPDAAPAPSDLDRVPAPSAGPSTEPEETPQPQRRQEPVRKPAKPASPPRAAPTRPVAVAAAPAPAPQPQPPATPRGACGARSNFSLYYCMQTQCRKPEFSAHAQCRQLRATGDVS